MSKYQASSSTQFKYIFGPVPSRRLGMSLGVDMVPYKTCSLNCVYCECGETTHHTVKREEYIPAQEILDELDRFLSGSVDIDVITFAGSGEPCLNSALKEVIEHVKLKYPAYKTAILTNNTLLSNNEIRDCLMCIDYVLPSLDAVSQEIFEKINIPCSDIRIESIIEDLMSFAKEFSGALWLEIFIIPGINDTAQELKSFKHVLGKIRPTRVQLNTLDRPGPCEWVKPASSTHLLQIADYLLPLPVEIITRKISIPLSRQKLRHQYKEDILATLKRRPMTLEDISVTLGRNINETQQIINTLIDTKKIVSDWINTKKFYTISQK